MTSLIPEHSRVRTGSCSQESYCTGSVCWSVHSKQRTLAARITPGRHCIGRPCVGNVGSLWHPFLMLRPAACSPRYPGEVERSGEKPLVDLRIYRQPRDGRSFCWPHIHTMPSFLVPLFIHTKTVLLAFTSALCHDDRCVHTSHRATAGRRRRHRHNRQQAVCAHYGGAGALGPMLNGQLLRVIAASGIGGSGREDVSLPAPPSISSASPGNQPYLEFPSRTQRESDPSGEPPLIRVR